MISIYLIYDTDLCRNLNPTFHTREAAEEHIKITHGNTPKTFAPFPNGSRYKIIEHPLYADGQQPEIVTQVTVTIRYNLEGDQIDYSVQENKLWEYEAPSLVTIKPYWHGSKGWDNKSVPVITVTTRGGTEQECLKKIADSFDVNFEKKKALLLSPINPPWGDAISYDNAQNTTWPKPFDEAIDEDKPYDKYLAPSAYSKSLYTDPPNPYSYTVKQRIRRPRKIAEEDKIEIVLEQ